MEADRLTLLLVGDGLTAFEHDARILEYGSSHRLLYAADLRNALCLLDNHSGVEAVLIYAGSSPLRFEKLCFVIRQLLRIPIILLCQGIGERETANLLDAGADDCLSMPVSQEELQARFKAVLRRYRKAVATPVADFSGSAES